MAAYVAVEERLVTSVKALIQALIPAQPALLPGLTAAQVYDQITIKQTTIQFPAVLVFIEGLLESYEVFSSEYEDKVMRPVGVAFLDRSPTDYIPNRGKYLLWRETIIRAFRVPCKETSVYLTVPEAKICTIDPQLIVNQRMPEYQKIMSGFTLRYMCLEQRAVGV